MYNKNVNIPKLKGEPDREGMNMGNFQSLRALVIRVPPFAVCKGSFFFLGRKGDYI